MSVNYSTDLKNYENLLPIIGGYQPVKLKEMSGYKLMSRFDFKFFFHSSLLPQILEELKNSYNILEIDNLRMLPYKTIYFDTPDDRMYTDHHNGKLKRYKVRIREYCNSHENFLEVKGKNNKGLVQKVRIPITSLDVHESDNAKFIQKNSPFKPEELSLKINVNFFRTTLVSKFSDERVTIDSGIVFNNNGIKTALGDISIVEIKRSGSKDDSMLFNLFRDMGINPNGFSKYCTGTIYTRDQVKKNNFKPMMLKLRKIQNPHSYDTVI